MHVLKCVNKVRNNLLDYAVAKNPPKNAPSDQADTDKWIFAVFLVTV